MSVKGRNDLYNVYIIISVPGSDLCLFKRRNMFVTHIMLCARARTHVFVYLFSANTSVYL